MFLNILLEFELVDKPRKTSDGNQAMRNLPPFWGAFPPLYHFLLFWLVKISFPSLKGPLFS